MTSRRSRLKAVTNLPVRRKVNTLPGNGNEATSVESVKSEKVFSSDLKSDKASAECPHLNSVVESNANDIPSESNSSVSAVLVNCAVSVKSNENSVSKYVCSENNQSDSKNLECTNDLSGDCKLLGFKPETNTSAFKSSKRFKPNLVSTSREKSRAKASEKIKENGSSGEQKCSSDNVNNNNSINNININNIIEENFKCYTLLSSQSVTFCPLAEYTITPLTPCMNTFNETTLNDLSLAQDFEEVQIFTEVESAELYENNNNNVNNNINSNNNNNNNNSNNNNNNNNNSNSESVIETETLEPVLTNLTTFSSEHEGNDSNFANLISNSTEPKTASENLSTKPSIKSRVANVKTSISGQDELLTNSVTQIKDTNILENGAPSGVSNVSSDVSSFKCSMSAVRRKRSKCNDLTKKLADAKREFQKKYEKIKPDRSTLKMIDLIFYNPATNPMESKAKFDKKDPSASPSNETNDLLIEESVDEPDALDCISLGLSDKGEAENASKMPVPQVKIGLDGEIILDEKSLIIETTDAKKRREHLQNSVPVFEDRGYKVSYYRGKSKKTRDWADCETKRFYKALNTIGPDFTLMQKYFPKRSRLELKNKFKREERLNRNLIDKALNNPSEFDMTQLEKDLAVEKEAEEEKIEMGLCRIIKQTPRKPRVKSSLLSREMIESDGESENNQSQSFSMSSKRFARIEKSKKDREFDFVFQKLLMKESEKQSGSVLPEISSFKKAFKQSDHGVT